MLNKDKADFFMRITRGNADLLRRMRNYIHPVVCAKKKNPWRAMEKRDFEFNQNIYIVLVQLLEKVHKLLVFKNDERVTKREKEILVMINGNSD